MLMPEQTLTMNLHDAAAAWCNHLPVRTVDVSGLGYAYEHTIHTLTFELVVSFLNKPVPDEKSKAIHIFEEEMGNIVKRTGLTPNSLQAGLAKSLAFHFLRDGYLATLRRFPVNRIMYIRKEEI